MYTPTYTRREVASLTVGAEFVDSSDIPHRVEGFAFHDSPGTVTVLTDLYPAGIYFRTTDLVWVLS
jgi:hypothetical protein